MHLNVGLITAFSNITHTYDCMSMLSTVVASNECWLASRDEPLYYAAVLLFQSYNVTPITVTDDAFTPTGEITESLNNGSIDVMFDYVTARSKHVDYLHLSSVFAGVHVAILKRIRPNPWYKTDITRLIGGLNGPIGWFLLVLTTLLFIVHILTERTFLTQHGNDAFSFWRQILPSNSCDTPLNERGITRRMVIYNAGMIAFVILFAVQSGLQQSLLLAKTPRVDEFMTGLVNDLEANRTRLSFQVIDSGYHTIFKNQPGVLGQRLAKSMSINPPVISLDDTTVMNDKVPIARVMGEYRLISFVSNMSDSDCSNYEFLILTESPIVWISLAMSGRMSMKKTEMFNMEIARRFSHINRRMTQPRYMSETCRRHFFPSPSDLQISFRSITWHMVNGLAFGSLGVGLLAGVVLMLEIAWKHFRKSSVSETRQKRRPIMICITPIDDEDHDRVLEECEKLFKNGHDVQFNFD